MRLKSIAIRAVSQSNISAMHLKGFTISLPSMSDHAEIVKAGAAFGSKARVREIEFEKAAVGRIT